MSSNGATNGHSHPTVQPEVESPPPAPVELPPQPALQRRADPPHRIASARTFAAVGRPRNSTANWKIACENRLPATMKRPPMKPPEQNATARAAIHP